MANDKPVRRQDNRSDQDESNTRQAETIGVGPSLLQLILVVVLVCALMMGPIVLVWQVDPTGPWRFMPILVFIVAAESVLTRRWLEWPGRRHGRPYYSLAELTLLLAVTPLFLWLASGRVPFPASASEFLVNPLTLFDLELVLYMLLTVVVWERAHSWARLFIALSITNHEIKYFTSTSLQRWSDRSIILPLKDRTELLHSFVRGWMVGGMILVITAALTTFDVRAASLSIVGSSQLRSVARLGLPPVLLLALLVYFIGGLWLISLGRIVVLKARWLADGSQRDLTLTRKWQSWAFALLVVAALVASALPIGSTFPLYQIVQAIGSVVATIVLGMMSFLTLLIYLVISLLPRSGTPSDLPLDLSQAGPTTAPDELPSDLAAMFSGSLFWLALIALTVLATLHFLSDRGVEIDGDTIKYLWRRFRRWLYNLREGVADLTPDLIPPWRLRLRRPSPGKRGLSRFGFLRVNALPPAEQVRFLYLSMIRHSDKQGLTRAPSETPREFGRSMKANWPESAADIDELTEAFHDARYSRQNIDRDYLKSVKDAWFRIRKALRSVPKKGSS